MNLEQKTWYALCKIGVEPTVECLREAVLRKDMLTVGVYSVREEVPEDPEILFLYLKEILHGPGERFYGVGSTKQSDFWMVEAVSHGADESLIIQLLFPLPEGASLLKWNEG